MSTRTAAEPVVFVLAILSFVGTASAYLHPGLGRFAQRDPLTYLDDHNAYAYLQDTPTKWRDPAGTRPVDDCGPAPLPNQCNGGPMAAADSGCQ